MRNAEFTHSRRSVCCEPFTKKYPRRLAEIEKCFGESERLTTVVRERLGGVSE